MNGAYLTDDDKEKILQSFAVTGIYRKTARETGFSASTVRRTVIANEPRMNQLDAQKKKDYDKLFIERCNEIVDLATARLKRMLEDEETKISAKDLAIIAGTHIDKKEVLKGNNVGEVSQNLIIIPERMKKDG